MKRNLFKLIAVAVLLLIATIGCKKDQNENVTNVTPNKPVTPEKEWVEVNGVTWATRNVDKPGTFAAKPENAGMFYQWNSPIGWSTTYPMISSNGDTIWNIQSNSPITIWEKENDPCPTGWRVPTISELASLYTSDSQWTMVNNVTGRIFGTGDNTIFLPAAGCRFYPCGGMVEDITEGYYWSNSSENGICFLGFDSSDHFTLSIANPPVYQLRSQGFSVRCVAE